MIKIKILIVEDDYLSRRYLEIILAKKYSYDFAINGAEAVSKFREAHTIGEPFQLIILDIMMPKMNGQEALVEIRMIEKNMDIMFEDRCKVIMMTAVNDFKEVKKAFQNQADAYIVKPIKKDKLYIEIEKLF